MAEFDTRPAAVDVTGIMERIRRGIRGRGGADDPERRTRELAGVTLDRCLEPLRAGSDVVERNRRLTPPGRFDRDGAGGSLAPEPFEFDEDTVYVSSRGTMGKLLYLIRRLLNPVLRLFFDPDPIIHAMMRQAEINSRLLDLLDRVNAEFERTGRKFAAREEIDALNYEVTSNLVTEMTRLAVDMKNHKLLVESVAGRLDFDERRARALESVGQARSAPPAEAPEAAEGDGAAAGADPAAPAPAAVAAAHRRGRGGRRARHAGGRRGRGGRRAARRRGRGRAGRKRGRGGRGGGAARRRAPGGRLRGAPGIGACLRRPRGRGPPRPAAPGRGPARAARRRRGSMRLGVVVQRYGAEIAGGSEYLCRLTAEQLARRHEVDVLTTCARDGRTWRNRYPEGDDRIRGVTVRRFANERTRDPGSFDEYSDWIQRHGHSAADEAEWLMRQGPWCPALQSYLEQHHRDYDALVFFDCLHAPTVLGLRVDPGAQHPGPRRAGRAGPAPGPLPGGVLAAGRHRLHHRGRARIPEAQFRRRREGGGDGGLRRRPAAVAAAREAAFGPVRVAPVRPRRRLPAAPPPLRPDRPLRRTGRARPGVRRDARVFRRPRRVRRRRVAGADGTQADADPERPAASARRPPVGDRAVGGPRGGHRGRGAGAVREPFAARPRVVRGGDSGARQRPQRRARGPLPAEQRRPVLRRPGRVPGVPPAPGPRRRPARGHGAPGAAPTSAPTTGGRSSSASTTG